MTAQERNHGVVVDADGVGRRVLEVCKTAVHDGATLHLSQVHELTGLHGLSSDLAFRVRYVRRGAAAAEATHVWDGAWDEWRKGRAETLSSSEDGSIESSLETPVD